MVWGLGRTLPVRSIAAGVRTVWSARSIMSKPLMPLEFCMKTDTRSWEPTVPVIGAGVVGHVVLPAGMMQTTPVEDA